MAKLEPFRALRPDPQVASQVSSVPYDVVSTEEARELASKSAWSLLHVTRSEIHFPPGSDPYQTAVYERARAELTRIRREAPLVLEEDPSLYLYRLVMGNHTQTGIAGLYSIAEYEAGTIRKHEKTRRDKEDDRTRHIVTTRAQTGVVFLTYRAQPAVDALVAQAVEEPPLYDFTSPDGVRHSVWRIAEEQTASWVEAFASVPELFIADGHHRAASAWRAAQEFSHLALPQTPAADLRSGFLAVAFPHNQLQILPYHRVVRDLGGRTLEEFWAELETCWEEVSDAPQPTAPGRVSVFAGGRWRTFVLRPAASSSPLAALDCQRLQDQLLAPVLGIEDPRTDRRIDFVGGIRGTGELERRVASGEMAAAFALYPVQLEELFRVASQGEIMPPKSTWFEPKLRDGLLIATFD